MVALRLMRLNCLLDRWPAGHGGSPGRRHAAGHRRHGAMMILIGALLLIFMVAVAFTANIAHMHLAKTELRSVTDAASKAAALELSRSGDISRAVQVGSDVAAQNRVVGQPLLLSPANFSFGYSIEDRLNGRFDFTASDRSINSVRVVGRRTSDSLSGTVPLFFGHFFDVPDFEPRSTTATATYLNRDVVLVVDRSDSMADQSINDLRAAVRTFTQTLRETPVEEFVGLASYSEFATVDVLLSPNLLAIDAAMNELKANGWTSISRGMEAGEQVFKTGRPPRFVERTMIVMTDGKHNRGPEPRIAAQRLAADGVTIHTITFGSDADRPRMQEVAQIGGGRHFHADNGLQLAEIYREIARSLSTLMTQ
jgi:Ca-activated chloride channel homolog